MQPLSVRVLRPTTTEFFDLRPERPLQIAQVYLGRLGQRPRKKTTLTSSPEGATQELLHPFRVLFLCRLSSWGVAPGYHVWPLQGLSTSRQGTFSDQSILHDRDSLSCPRGSSYKRIFLSRQGTFSDQSILHDRDIEDYEYLLMLRKAVDSGAGTAEARAQASRLLDELPARVGTDVKANHFFTWKPAGLPTPADAARVEILDALQALQSGK